MTTTMTMILTYLFIFLLTTIYCYLLMLAVVDTVVLFVSAFKTWIRVVSGVEWLHGSSFTCRGLMFLVLVALHLSAWLIVVVSADRFQTRSDSWNLHPVNSVVSWRQI